MKSKKDECYYAAKGSRNQCSGAEGHEQGRIRLEAERLFVSTIAEKMLQAIIIKIFQIGVL
jgi:hypothetical protein